MLPASFFIGMVTSWGSQDSCCELSKDFPRAEGRSYVTNLLSAQSISCQKPFFRLYSCVRCIVYRCVYEVELGQ